jgi:hypothetical protein
LHHAAGARGLFKNGDLVAGGLQAIGGSQAGDTGADDGNIF